MSITLENHVRGGAKLGFYVHGYGFYEGKDEVSMVNKEGQWDW